MPIKTYFQASVRTFLKAEDDTLLGQLTNAHRHPLDLEQKAAWLKQISILKTKLIGLQEGHLFLEFTIPRMGKRADVILLVSGIVFVIEFKVGAAQFDRSSIEQVEDYALDLKNFHEGSHHAHVVPILGSDEVPVEKVAIFDEAQRAWTREQASKFMQSKRGHVDFDMSEPSFLISVMDRHQDWCTVVCLVGGGQEINTGEAGLSEWIDALSQDYASWDIYISKRIVEPDFSGHSDARKFLSLPYVSQNEELHLAVSMRSFRAEEVSALVGAIIDNDPSELRRHMDMVRSRYPILVTRELEVAREWLNTTARGSERYGLVASSGAHRLRPEGIHIKSAIDPANWFLNNRADVRSSFYLEEVASEFDVQGLELDWACVCWDADFRYREGAWNHYNFKGTKWQSVNDPDRQRYLKNAYRVILTRARQGMVVFVPKGDAGDPTRPPSFYSDTYEYLRECGIQTL